MFRVLTPHRRERPVSGVGREVRQHVLRAVIVLNAPRVGLRSYLGVRGGVAKMIKALAAAASMPTAKKTRKASSARR